MIRVININSAMGLRGIRILVIKVLSLGLGLGFKDITV